MENKSDIYYNEFFEGLPKLPDDQFKAYMEEWRRKKKVFVEKPLLNNLTKNDIWQDRAKFYFLPFLVNCYKFTRQNELPMFAIPVSPTCMFYRDRLHLRNFMDTVHQAFFAMMDVCIPKGEQIMLLVEKHFYITDPIDGGTQQLYNMLWDVDLEPVVNKVYLPPGQNFKPRMGVSSEPIQYPTAWKKDDLNPGVPADGIELLRKTLWFRDDLDFLCKRYDLDGQCVSKEIVDLTNVPEDKKELYEKTARTFYFRIFTPKYMDDDVEVVSSNSDLDDFDDDDFEIDSTQIGLLDSTLDFEQEDDKMNKIIAFFAKMPKVTGLVQGMVDMMESLTRILPLVIVKLDDDNLKGSLKRTVDIINLGLGKVLKLCAYLGIKVQKKPNGAIGEIVKNRFKKDKKDFLEYEIDELNKSLDELENVDDDGKPQKPPKGEIPIDVKPNHLYPQKMPLRPPVPPKPPIVVPPEPPPVDVKPEPPPPPKPPKPEVDSSGSEIKPEPPPIPSVMPEPPNHPPKDVNGIK